MLNVTMKYKGEEKTINIKKCELYNWVHGNFSCDCNRSIEFGLKEELECNDFNNEIKIIITDNENTIYKDSFID